MGQAVSSRRCGLNQRPQMPLSGCADLATSGTAFARSVIGAARFNSDMPRSATLLIIGCAIALSAAFLFAFVVLGLIG